MNLQEIDLYDGTTTYINLDQVAEIHDMTTDPNNPIWNVYLSNGKWFTTTTDLVTPPQP